MSFDFDTVIDRRNTTSLKWELYKDRDILPMWVADMDFAAPPAVLAAIQKRVDHGVLAYSVPPQALVDAVIERMLGATDSDELDGPVPGPQRSDELLGLGNTLDRLGLALGAQPDVAGALVITVAILAHNTIHHVLTWLGAAKIGAVYLAIVTVLPSLLGWFWGIPVGLSGVSIIIVAGVALETTKQIESQLMMRNHEGFLS